MRFQPIYRVSRSKIEAQYRRSYSQIHPKSERPSFGIAFDIDGVILRGGTPVGGSPQALRKLYHDNGTLRIPYIFLTNGGGVPESKRALELSGLLGVHLSPLQVVLGHSPFKELVNRFENELIVAIGKGEPAAVMSEYGFKKVLSMDEYASYFQDIDPLSQFKGWAAKQAKDGCKESQLRYNVSSDRVKGAFVVSDPIDWGRDIQVCISALRAFMAQYETYRPCEWCGGLPGKDVGHQPPLYFAADDLEYQAAFPSERLGMGAFRIALESIFNRIHTNPLKFTSFGKPNPFVFKNAEAILGQILSSMNQDQDTVNEVKGHQFSTIYMIGDNPAVDINGVIKSGHPWFSILTRTGVFRGKDNHTQYPADLVVETVEDAVDYILKKELH